MYVNVKADGLVRCIPIQILTINHRMFSAMFTLFIKFSCNAQRDEVVICVS